MLIQKNLLSLRHVILLVESVSFNDLWIALVNDIEEFLAVQDRIGVSDFQFFDVFKIIQYPDELSRNFRIFSSLTSAPLIVIFS